MRKTCPVTAKETNAAASTKAATVTAMCGTLLEPLRLDLIRAVFFATPSHCSGNVNTPIKPHREDPGMAIGLWTSLTGTVESSTA